eukprot:scaffold1051_cov119-Cylindrotheca_fusiformis.AAC.23
MRSTTTTILGVLLFASSSAFAFHNPIPPTIHRPTTTPLGVGTSAIETESDARLILMRARECAYGDASDCSVEDCEILLREMIRVQSGCVAGTLVGHDLCDEQDIAADIVAHLREKVKHHRVTAAKQKTKSVVPMVATELSLGALMLVVAIFWSTLDITEHQGVSPMTMQEWWSAVRGGHIGDAVMQQIENGSF